MKGEGMTVKETELYGPVRDYFIDRGFKVRAEVRDIDVVAVKEDLLVGIELKKRLTVDLLTQGALRQKTCDLVYVAVPKPKRIVKDKAMKNLLYLLRRLELGLLYVDLEKKRVLEVLVPSFYALDQGRRARIKEKVRILEETHKRSMDGNVGGSKGKKLLTAYREEALRAVALLRLKGVVSPKELKARGLKSSLLNNNYYQWFFKVGHGKYALKEGLSLEKEYEVLVEDFIKEYTQLEKP